jgi:hypothetical protein
LPLASKTKSRYALLRDVETLIIEDDFLSSAYPPVSRKSDAVNDVRSSGRHGDLHCAAVGSAQGGEPCSHRLRLNGPEGTGAILGYALLSIR